ncbi:MAG: hypothetical protein ACLP50_15310 [Solirubrobacteraceae bacterium]
MKLGKQPATYDSRDIRYADVRPSGVSLPKVPPPGGGYGTDFSDWLMLGNGPCDDGSVQSGWAAFQGAGDCAWAGPAHEEMEACKNAGRPVPAFTCLNVLQQYSAYSGYNLQTGAGDNGSNVRDVLTWRQTKGLVDAAGAAHKIGTFVSLEPGNTDQLWEALWLFESVGIGINFPNSAMDQFNAGQMWSVVAGTTIEGGHYIPLVGHPVQNVWTCVTWAKRQTMTAQFLTTYCDEAWAYIDPERYNAVTGDTLQKFTDADLDKYITLFSQQIAKTT